MASSALLLWMGVIFGFSSMHGAAASSGFPFWKLLERKGAHVFEYFVLAVLAFHWIRFHISEARFQVSLFLAAAFSLTYAFSDEFHQIFVPGREGKLSDVGIDLIGIGLAVAVVSYISRKNKKS